MTYGLEYAIKAENLSKEYYKKVEGQNREQSFFALNNISFSLEKGKVLGVIGKNGSGKSTLLRILSGITKPTSGTVELNGRVSSILDIGTGFHPDLSGRENTFLRGQLLGLTKAKVKECFDEIVEFSGVENFIDSPVKHYSSGMFLRLAFSIIVNMESDIILLDEVLSVGDLEFQAKCREKIESKAKQGCTIVIVSHQVNQFRFLIEEILHLEGGIIINKGAPSQVLENYIENNLSPKEKIKSRINFEEEKQSRKELIQPGNARFKVREIGYKLIKSKSVVPLESVLVMLEVEVYESAEEILEIAISVSDLIGNVLIMDSPGLTGNLSQLYNSPGTYKIEALIPGNLLGKGTKQIGLFLTNSNGKMFFKDRRLLTVKFSKEKDPGKTAEIESQGTPQLDWKIIP